MAMEHTMLALDLFGFALLIGTALILALNLRDFWGATAGGAFVYFGAATLVIGLIRVFIHLAEHETFIISEETLVIGWHLLFYLAMALFLAGSMTMLELVRTDTAVRHSFRQRLYLSNTAIIVGIAVFFGSVAADHWITATFGGSFLERSGAVHFLAFALAGAVTVLLIRLRKRLGPYLAAIANPLIAALFFLGLVHAWELLTESWHVIALDTEVIEFVETTLTAPALAFIFYAFARSRKLIALPTRPSQE